MKSSFHRPIIQPGEKFGWVEGAPDPADHYMLARESAWALLHRVRAGDDEELVKRVIHLVETDGIDDIAELWADAHANSLPGTLWRLYLLQSVTAKRPDHVAELYRVGLRESKTIDSVIAGAPDPITPEALKILSDEILRGVFSGDFAQALERAAGASFVLATGAAKLADLSDWHSEDDATNYTKEALRFDALARELNANAKAWRNGLFE